MTGPSRPLVTWLRGRRGERSPLFGFYCFVGGLAGFGLLCMALIFVGTLAGIWS